MAIQVGGGKGESVIYFEKYNIWTLVNYL
jgi:hypothetical protein